MKKVGNIEAEQRVEKIIELITSGVSETKIVEYCIKKLNWGINGAMIRRYKARATEYFKEYSKINRDEQIGLAIRRYEEAIKLGIANKSSKSIVIAQKAICDLLGLNAPTKQEITGKDGRPLIEEIKVTLPSEVKNNIKKNKQKVISKKQ